MTRRIAIIGANGRVGSELAVRLRDISGLEVIGICRSPAGSAFLRMAGVTCVHGSIQDADVARQLLANADVVVNLAYRWPHDRATRIANRSIVANASAYAPSGSHVVHASTVMVHALDLPVRLPDAYGTEKLLNERVARREASSRDIGLTVLRIGHMLGSLQPQSAAVSAALARQSVPLKNEGRHNSNTVFVASLAAAIHRAALRELPVGTFDLVSAPQWTWREVFQHYADQHGVILRVVPDETRISIRSAVSARAKIGLAYAPQRHAERAYGMYLLRRARTAPTPVIEQAPIPDATRWRTAPGRGLPGAMAVDEARTRYPFVVNRPGVDSLPPGWKAYKWGREG